MPLIPCPLNDQHCEDLARIIDTIPQVIELVKDCEECGVHLPGALESLQISQDQAHKLKKMADKWRKKYHNN